LFFEKKLSFIGKTIKMTEEEDPALGLEPVAKFLPSARFKSGNNLVQRDRRMTRLMMAWLFYTTHLPIKEAI
jgi:hypothetical protein